MEQYRQRSCKTALGFEGSIIIADGEPAIQISVASDDEDAATSSFAPPSASNCMSANLSTPIPPTPSHISDTNPSRHPLLPILYGHVERMEGSLQPKKLWGWQPHQRRKRERPRAKWNTQIQKDMQRRQLEDNQWEDKKARRLGCERRP
ncbi:hypothetical protein ILUMI_05689 [Ignelater luminosus]|uniref:Uncharacterized protein n=1 Tax=Ignelater luminosus TaxID=2038154 RepID=A0A8K0DA12_IGNLU|nr:hypothetical protein ILUMI_05689 [Ignelater luminosus]